MATAGDPPGPDGSTPLDWATLLKRVYNIDALACPCGGRLKFEASPPDERQLYDESPSEEAYFHDPIYDDW